MPMDNYVEAPEEYTGEGPSLFMAGGITGCSDWQEDMRVWLTSSNIQPVTLLNPRRKNFPIHDPSAAKAQIEWEARHLKKATMISFFFPDETLCPIVLYELGSWSRTGKKIFVGMRPGYKRKQDVIIQTGIYRPDVEVVESFDLLCMQITDYIHKVYAPI